MIAVGFGRRIRMKLLVLGATGGTGMEVIRQAVERGHDVTALVRAPERLQPFRGRIAIVQGNLLEQRELEPVVLGQDAVLSAFGPRDRKGRDRGPFASALTRAMAMTRVQRVVVLSSAFLFTDSLAPRIVGRLFFADVVEDSRQMEAIVSKSGLEWTIVRPPRLTDQPARGHYRMQEGHLPTLGFAIARADLAEFMIRAAENHLALGAVVGISN